MEEILRNLLSNDGDGVREASRLLKECINKPETVGVLCNLLSNHQNFEMRQYATIILKKRFDKKMKWQSQDPATRAEIKNGLLQIFVKEPEKSVKNCLAQLIGTILKHDYPEWNELMSFLQQSMTSENMNDKELGFFMLSSLTETCPEEMQNHAASFCAHFSSTLSEMTDKASPVAYFIMLCLAHMCPSLTNNKELLNIYNEILPKTYEVVYALAEKRTDRAAEALDLYNELIAEKGASAILNSKWKGIVSLCLDLTQKSKSEDLQIRALNVISSIADVNVKLLFKEGCMNNILSVIFNILKSPPLDDEEEQYFSSDSSEDTLLSCACETLDAIAIGADAKKLMNPLTAMVEPAFKSENPYEKKAAYLVMGIVCQGCESYVRTKLLGTLVNLVQTGVTDPNPVVRNAALFTMGQMGEHLQPEISQSAMEVMPLLINQLDMLGEEGKGGARLGQRVDRLFYAVERFSETLESSLSHFLKELISRLLILASPPYHTHIRELSLGAIATAISSVEDGISPYFNDIMNVLNLYLSPQTNPETTSVQVEALDTLGMLARHVGRNEFGPLALDSVKLGLELIANTDDPDIRKSSYGLFGSVSNVLKQEMGPLLQNIVAPILNSIKDEQAFIVHSKDEISAAFPLYDTDEENEDEDLDDISIENDYVEEKEEACFALKELALNTGESFAPFLEPSIEEVYKLLNFPSIEVRKAALEAEAQFCISFVHIMYNASQGDNKLAFIIMEKLIVKTIEIIKTDLSKEVAFSGLECIQLMLKEIGQQIGCVDQLKLIIIGTIKDVLNSKTECQSTLSEPCEDETTNSELLDAAADVIPHLSKAMTQEDFARVFAEFLPLIRNRVIHGDEDEDSEDEDDEGVQGSRANAIGVLAECMSGLGIQVGQFISGLLPYLLGLTKDSDTNVRNNSLFAIGEMTLHGKEHMFQNYPTILNALSQVLSSETKPKVLDNACGVIARMILTNLELIPLQQVFHALITQLPLKEDYSEDVWVMKSIKHVIETVPEVAQPELFRILQDVGFTMYAHASDDECKDVILNIYRLTISRFPQECQVVIPQLPPQVLQVLRETGIINE